MSQPNVLFIITDQQRADHVGFMRNDVIATPNLDALAAGGAVFTNAWVANPVCMPNRSTILTGRMPTAHGVIFNDRSLDPNANTFARRMRGAGYDTALIGKSHLQHGMSRNSVVPFRGEPAVAAHHAAGWDTQEDFERYIGERDPELADFYGFDDVELAIDHGARATGHHLSWALKEGGRREDLFVPYNDSSPAKKRSDTWWQIYQPPYDAALHSTSYVTGRSLAWLDDAARADKPWMLWCSFPDPHHPLTPPGEWFNRHNPADMVLPGSRHDPLDHAPAHLQMFRNTHPRDQRNWVAPCGYGDDALLAEAIAATYGMVEMIDDGVGQILARLTELGMREDTIVVFTSDHGDMMGDHGLFLKGFMHYRGTLQVPLVIDVPEQAPARTNALASSLDLCPTLLDLCQIRGFDGIQGRSLAPVLGNPDTEVNEHVLIEDDVSNITAKLTPLPGKTRTVITNEFRYTRNSKGEEQLFDLQADPDEMTDLKHINTAARADMMEHLADALIAADDAARGAPFDHRF